MLKIFSERNRQMLTSTKELLVGYITAGYPSSKEFLDTIVGCAENGIDIFEVGYPAKNPFADGEIIRKAHGVVNHEEVCDITYWKQIRKAIDKPIWIMGYSADLVETQKYKELAENGVVDAFVIPDIDLALAEKIANEVSEFGVDIVFFIPNGEENLLKYIDLFPLLYYQLVNGKTGTQASKDENFEGIKTILTVHKDSYVFGGFGINSRERAKQITDIGFSGAIVGTAMMAQLNISAETLFNFIKQLKIRA